MLIVKQDSKRKQITFKWSGPSIPSIFPSYSSVHPWPSLKAAVAVSERTSSSNSVSSSTSAVLDMKRSYRPVDEQPAVAKKKKIEDENNEETRAGLMPLSLLPATTVMKKRRLRSVSEATKLPSGHGINTSIWNNSLRHGSNYHSHRRLSSHLQEQPLAHRCSIKVPQKRTSSMASSSSSSSFPSSYSCSSCLPHLNPKQMQVPPPSSSTNHIVSAMPPYNLNLLQKHHHHLPDASATVATSAVSEDSTTTTKQYQHPRNHHSFVNDLNATANDANAAATVAAAASIMEYVHAVSSPMVLQVKNEQLTKELASAKVRETELLRRIAKLEDQVSKFIDDKTMTISSSRSSSTAAIAMAGTSSSFYSSSSSTRFATLFNTPSSIVQTAKTKATVRKRACST